MRTDQGPLNRVVVTADGTARVSCRPRGSELRDLTDAESVRWVHWFSALPGLLSLVGLLLHHTAYRRAWRVTVEPAASSGSAIQVGGDLDKVRSMRVFAELVDWLESGRHVDDFPVG
ncbi:hypothetical protein [Nocardioides humi]|uniref:Uncharacterized protein n=1 Tax=Nocardioides humi TaxID=449461 RepID=A0ABN1ZTK4_9ACTN|nr:hypothetical protein [Nocardioides humi]